VTQQAHRAETRPPQYKAAAKALHWLIALMVFGLLAVGLYMTELNTTPQKIQLYMTHKSVGLTVLLLMALRLLYRWRNPAPALPEAMPAWQKRAAALTHVMLYLLLLAMPISGWLMNSASGFPMKYFGWFRVPDLIARDAERLAFFKAAHEYIAWTLIALIVLHVLAALKHHLLNRDDILRRMLP
jgi:cytochrome b561